MLASLTPQQITMAALFFGVLIAFEGVRRLLSRDGRAEDQRVRRIRMIREGRTPEEALQLLRAPEKKSRVARLPLLGDLPQQLRQAGISTPPRLFLMGSAGAVALVYLFVSTLVGPLLAMACALGAGIGLPVAIVRMLRKRRIEAFVAQMPDALDLMMRGLRIGHPVNVTFTNVATMMEEPIAGEFAQMADQIAYGDDLTDALFDLADRIDQEDVHYLAVSVAIQHGTGGNLAGMLGTLAQTIRDRAMMRRRVMALSSEGRLSAFFLSALPVGIYLATSISSPDYYGSVRDDPAFLPVALIIIGLVTANYLALRKLVNFKV